MIRMKLELIHNITKMIFKIKVANNSYSQYFLILVFELLVQFKYQISKPTNCRSNSYLGLLHFFVDWVDWVLTWVLILMIDVGAFSNLTVVLTSIPLGYFQTILHRYQKIIYGILLEYFWVFSILYIPTQWKSQMLVAKSEFKQLMMIV